MKKSFLEMAEIAQKELNEAISPIPQSIKASLLKEILNNALFRSKFGSGALRDQTAENVALMVYRAALGNVTKLKELLANPEKLAKTIEMIVSDTTRQLQAQGQETKKVANSLKNPSTEADHDRLWTGTSRIQGTAK